MTLLLLLEMVASALGDRVAVTSGDRHLTYRRLLDAAGAGASIVQQTGARHVVYIGTSDLAFPVALFAAAWAGVPLLPLSYRLSDAQLAALLANHDDVLVLAEDPERFAGSGATVLSLEGWAARTIDVDEGDATDSGAAEPSTTDGEDVAVLLYTSGTTSSPKAVVLRHRHLTAYVVGSVELADAEEVEANLVAVPPYHIAGVANLLTNAYRGRRVVYLPDFTPERWLELVRREGVTNALLVPTMLARVVDHLDGAPAACPTLRHLAYGGARMPVPVLERALAAFDGTGFVNAYGLTETSSTLAVLSPEDHDAARAGDPVARARLASVGRVLPGIEVQVRDGELWVRGEQVSGEYLGLGTSLDADGWFPTRDAGHLDDDGYLFIEGRADDTIIRGGENIAPAEIEDVLLAHPDVTDAAVVGLPDEEWGQTIAAAVVLRPGAEPDAEALRTFARERVRSSMTPDVLVFREALPHTDTGKVLRRQVLADLVEEIDR